MMHYRVAPGSRVRLDQYDPDDTGESRGREYADAERATDLARMAALQNRLYAENKRALLVVLQGMDTAGKDGTIKHVFSGVNPQGCDVAVFGPPAGEEAQHDFLWRIYRRVPRRGHIGIFNRSHYEDVLVARVRKLVPKAVWSRRYDQINAFERLLVENGTTIVKFFLYISKGEQRERLRERQADPAKNWKFSASDIADRQRWKQYIRAYEDALSHCSTRHAPWFVVPSNRKWYRNLVVARIITETLEAMNPRIPRPKIDRTKIR
jgi:PPK2 family polyphosphate:nucleotide phosphotransferase